MPVAVFDDSDLLTIHTRCRVFAATIALDSVRNTFITASKVSPGTGTFVATTNTPSHELTLQANHLLHAQTARREGQADIHLGRQLP